ncbi:MAG: peptide ABC transporter substrate-binding protein [Oscillospiraceae bacterium]|nr:peptide ABC transporter substrate-binding protein [Ruminococcus sp.]MDY3087757.1 peptide ABC transporter substrate-binding protein [Oscillospiraceae bacterium]
MPKKILSLFLALVAAISLCACGGSSEDILILPIESDPICLDPQVADSKEAKLMIANCFEGLVRLNKDYKIIPGVAESWEISKDGLTYTFKLRKDTHWKLLNSFEDVLPEGYKDTYRTQVIAADFVYGISRALDPATQAGDAEKLFSIKNASAVNSGKQPTSALGISAQDDSTLVITLERADPDFLRILTLPVAMPCHEEFFKATHAKYCLDLKYTFCNGPFYLSRWAEDNTLSMYKNDEYKGNVKVNPDELYFYVNTEEASVVKKIRQRTYDCAFLSEAAKNELSDNDKLSNYSIENMIYGLCFNCSDSVLSDEDMRRALAMVTKTSELTANSDNAFTKGIVPDCVRYGENSYREAAGNVSGIAYNEQQALTLWKKGLKKLDITTAEVVITCAEENAPLMQQTIQNWQRVFSTSILAKVEVKTAEQISTMIYNTSYQVLYHKITTDSSTVTDTLKKFTSDSSSNIFGFADKNYDKTVNSIITTYSGAAKLNGCVNAEKYILDKAVFLPMLGGSSYAVVNKGVDGLYFAPAFESVCMISGGHS